MIDDYGFARIAMEHNFLKNCLALDVASQRDPKKYLNSDTRKDVVACNLRLRSGLNSTANVETLLSSTLDVNQIENRKCLKLIMLSVRLLVMQGLELQGEKMMIANLTLL